MSQFHPTCKTYIDALGTKAFPRVADSCVFPRISGTASFSRFWVFEITLRPQITNNHSCKKNTYKNERNFFHGYLYVLAIFCSMIQAIAIVPSVNLSWLDVTTIHLGERSLCLRRRHSERHESREISQSQIDIHNLTSHNRK